MMRWGYFNIGLDLGYRAGVNLAGRRQAGCCTKPEKHGLVDAPRGPRWNPAPFADEQRGVKMDLTGRKCPTGIDSRSEGRLTSSA